MQDGESEAERIEVRDGEEVVLADITVPAEAAVDAASAPEPALSKFRLVMGALEPERDEEAVVGPGGRRRTTGFANSSAQSLLSERGRRIDDLEEPIDVRSSASVRRADCALRGAGLRHEQEGSGAGAPAEAGQIPLRNRNRPPGQRALRPGHSGVPHRREPRSEEREDPGRPGRGLHTQGQGRGCGGAPAACPRDLSRSTTMPG